MARYIENRRRAHKGHDPNDRAHDRAIEQYIRRLNPEDLDILLNGEEDERPRLPGSWGKSCPMSLCGITTLARGV